MARPLRLQVNDGIYHVTARGNDRGLIYRTHADRREFLLVLKQTTSRFGWRCLTYCLMDNHFHLLVRTPKPNLARGVQQLKSSYAQRFNRQHGRVGHLFGGRYGGDLIQRDAHVLEVFRYIALNPVRAGLCAHPSSWPWSAHAAIAGHAPGASFLAVEEARAWFAEPSGAHGADAYSAFVSEDAPEYRPPPAGVAGSTDFIRDVLRNVESDPEIPRRYWGAGRPSLDDLFSCDDTGRAIATAYRTHGYTMASIASYLGCHVSTVSRRLRTYERRVLECKI